MTSHCQSGYVPNHQSKQVVLPPETRKNITVNTASSGTKLSKVTFTDVYTVFITNSAEYQILHLPIPNMVPVPVLFLPAGH